MTLNAKLTRRQALCSLAAATTLPFTPAVFGQRNAMRGALMILTTPYTESGELDYEDLAREVAFCAQSGVQGIVWPQNSSEQRYLSKEERIRGFQVLAQARQNTDLLLVLGVQAEDTAGMEEYARIAESLAPDGMIAIPPTTANSLSDIRDYYAALCAITGRPIFVQTSGGAGY